MVAQILHFDLAGFLVEHCTKVVDYGKHASAMMTYEELWVKTQDYATWMTRHVSESSNAPFTEFAQHCLVRSVFSDF